ncbi:hypothetical protein [Streptomyces sp. NPDC020965]|uniref:hypothetical protein n=1 Tax=Streptomyces sp. NPDC020965 TaxID=3365105 RepID=UPI0037907823
MLPEIDRVNEPVDDLVAKVRRYTEWFELLAPKADPDHERAARWEGAAVHGFRLWPRLYPRLPAGSYVLVAFVFTGKTVEQRDSRIRRLEQAAHTSFAGEPYPEPGRGDYGCRRPPGGASGRHRVGADHRRLQGRGRCGVAQARAG